MVSKKSLPRWKKTCCVCFSWQYEWMRMIILILVSHWDQKKKAKKKVGQDGCNDSCCGRCKAQLGNEDTPGVGWTTRAETQRAMWHVGTRALLCPQRSVSQKTTREICDNSEFLFSGKKLGETTSKLGLTFLEHPPPKKFPEMSSTLASH